MASDSKSPEATHAEVDSVNQRGEEASARSSEAKSESERPANGISNKPSDPRFGSIKPVKGDANPQAASVLEALKSGAQPERLSLMHPPSKPFDQSAFEANPKAYLDVVEPGRVFQTMQPGKDVPALKIVGDGYYRLQQGQTVKLSAQSAPKAPITFTSTDLGAFAENNLNSVTVRADEKGLATVTFVAIAGTLNDVNILAGSPMASGQAHFVVDVEQSKGDAQRQ